MCILEPAYEAGRNLHSTTSTLYSLHYIMMILCAVEEPIYYHPFTLVKKYFQSTHVQQLHIHLDSHWVKMGKIKHLQRNLLNISSLYSSYSVRMKKVMKICLSWYMGFIFKWFLNSVYFAKRHEETFLQNVLYFKVLSFTFWPCYFLL